MLINSHPSTEALSKILNHEETPSTIKNIATSALKQSPDGKEVLARQDTGTT